MRSIDYSLFVPKFYQMDPKHEDLLFDGTDLREGMIVLIEHPMYRADVDVELSGAELEQAMRFNRWAMITRLNITGNELTFVAEYADGSKKKISASAKESWLMMLPNEVEDRAVGTAQVTEPKAWATTNTPPFGGGDGDLLDTSLPKRSPGGKLLFDDMVAARDESISLNRDRLNETQI